MMYLIAPFVQIGTIMPFAATGVGVVVTNMKLQQQAANQRWLTRLRHAP